MAKGVRRARRGAAGCGLFFAWGDPSLPPLGWSQLRVPVHRRPGATCISWSVRLDDLADAATGRVRVAPADPRSHGQRTVCWRTRQRGSKSIEWRQPSSRASPRAEPLSSHCAGLGRCGPCGGKRRASISCGSATADGAPSVGASDGYQTGRAATLSAASPWHRFRTAALLLCRPPSPSSPADPGFVPTVFLLRLRRGGGVRYATVHWQVRRPGKANPKADQHRRSAVCPNPTVGAVSAAPVVACRFRKSRWARPSGRDFTGISSNAAATTWRPDEEDAPPPLRRPQFAQRGRIGGLIMACHGGDGC